MTRNPPMRVVLAALSVVALFNGGCADREADAAALTHGGNPGHGKGLIRAYGCGACHTIPGVRGAKSTVGPNLAGVASRAYVAGVTPNTPENLMRWIRNPRAVDDKTAMPNLDVSERDARDIAAYLYTLR